MLWGLNGAKRMLTERKVEGMKGPPSVLREEADARNFLKTKLSNVWETFIYFEIGLGSARSRCHSLRRICRVRINIVLLRHEAIIFATLSSSFISLF